MSEISEPLRHPLSLFDNTGKVAIITGASGAFGRGCAITLGALGGKLVLASGSKAELDEVAAEVKDVGGEVETIVRRPDSLEDAKAMLDARAAALRQGRSARGGVGHEQAGLHPRARIRGLAGGDGCQCARHLVHGQGGRRALDRQQAARQGAADVVGARPPRQLSPATPAIARRKARPTRSPACSRPSGRSTASP